MENKWVSRKELEKEMKKSLYYAQNSVKCKHCGHAMLLGIKDKRVCSWCGNYIFKDDKTEFMYRMGEIK